MFPGAGARVYYNDAGEPLGWDYPDYDEPPDPDQDEEWYREMMGEADEEEAEADNNMEEQAR